VAWISSDLETLKASVTYTWSSASTRLSGSITVPDGFVVGFHLVSELLSAQPSVFVADVAYGSVYYYRAGFRGRPSVLY
jgi:hypothetical protein